jgi:hypothetical protein
VKSHPLLRRMCTYLGIEGVSIKIFGSKNLLSVIPAFWKLVDLIITDEHYTHSRGLMPIYSGARYHDYLENVRDRRSTFGYV